VRITRIQTEDPWDIWESEGRRLPKRKTPSKESARVYNETSEIEKKGFPGGESFLQRGQGNPEKKGKESAPGKEAPLSLRRKAQKQGASLVLPERGRKVISRKGEKKPVGKEGKLFHALSREEE